MLPPLPTADLENARRQCGYAQICGIDEAGRGPLAGPVVAAAVILPPGDIQDEAFAGLADSKKMSATARETLFEVIKTRAAVGIGIVDVAEIDLLNILGATMKAMADAVRGLPVAAGYALVDGNRMPVLTCEGEAIVKGDSKCVSIAAASVIAKVTRDRIMTNLDAQHPGYGWARNAGYGTAEHLAALKSLGPTPHHRRSFAPVRAALSDGS